MAEAIVQERLGRESAPPSYVSPPLEKESDEIVGTDLRFKLGKGIAVKVVSNKDLSADDINRLVALLQAQSIALSN